MNRFQGWLCSALGLITITGLLLTGCGDDPVDPGPPEPEGFSRTTFFHANPAYTSEVYFYRGDTTDLSVNLAYGKFVTREVPNGSDVKYSVKAADGTSLSSTSARFDSTLKEIVIFTGDANTREVIIASANSLTSIGASNAAVRFVHAEKDAQKKQILVNDTNGLVLTASTVSYKGGSEFVQVPTSSTARFWIVDPEKKETAIEVPAGNLTPGEHYTIVLHGAKAAPVNKPVATLIVEP